MIRATSTDTTPDIYYRDLSTLAMGRWHDMTHNTVTLPRVTITGFRAIFRLYMYEIQRGLVFPGLLIL